jgi:hypothetical protein
MMPREGAEPTALVLIVAWREQGRIVARITMSPDLERLEERVHYAGSVDEIAVRVATFLNDFVAD